MSLRRTTIGALVLLAGLVAAATPALASGPLYVTGPDATFPGQGFRWTLNPISYKTDKNGLGNQTNDQANTLVSDAFAVWHGVSTANLSFQNAGQLGSDVTSGNILAFQNAIGGCNDATQPVNSIIYDVDGSATTALGMDNNSILGFAGAVCLGTVNGTIARGWAVLNGRFIDGQPNSTSHRTVTLDTFKAVFIHEFGHLLGLDHTQINLNCLTDPASCPSGSTDLQGVPTMFPVLLSLNQATPKTDDIARISQLYPASNFTSTTGRLQGHIFFSDGATPAQGFNVIARKTDDPRRVAVSCVSGFLYTAAAGNPLAPANGTESSFGSLDETLIGFFDIPGLPPGSYTVEVEAINNSGTHAFIGGSGLGPMGNLGFEYKMPGSCQREFLNNPETATDGCTAQTTLTVNANQTVDVHTDIILDGTPPRYDAWEDGP